MGTKKINEALGISNVQDFLADLNIENETRQLSEMEEQMKDNVEKIDTEITKFKNGQLQDINITDLNSSLNEIKDLINVSKQTIQHVYEQIMDSELQDPELIQALSKLMESSHLAIKEYVDIFKDRVQFYDKIRIEQLKHEFKLKEMTHKHKLEMEKLDRLQKKDVIEVNPNTTVFSQEDIIKTLDQVGSVPS